MTQDEIEEGKVLSRYAIAFSMKHAGGKRTMKDIRNAVATLFGAEVDTTLDATDAKRKELERAQASRDFYKRRCEALQAVQNKMRDPERKAVCDILANGSTAALTSNVRKTTYWQNLKKHPG